MLKLLKRYWVVIRRPSVHFSLGFLTIGGFIGGVLFWGAFNTAMEMTNTEKFCTGCHEMRDNVFAELKTTIHYTNRSGVRAVCSDCHVPHNWTDKMARKMQASKEVWGKIFGTINTREKFVEKRLELAQHEWARLKANDSLECRNCHNYDSMDFTRQSQRAQNMHSTYLANKEKTCIDCHKGIAHTLPHIPPGVGPTDTPGQTVPTSDEVAQLAMPGHENGTPLLQVDSLACRRGGRSLFKGLSFELHAGEALELRGANGSGKTSLLRLMAGLMPAAAGVVHWRGAAHDIAYLGHLNGLSPDLSALENLRFAQQLAGGDPSTPAAELQRWGMDKLATRPVHRLSQGQQRRTALARLGLVRRRMWLLDEPCAGLDEPGERLFDARLAEHLDAGGSAVVATHQPLRLPAGRCRPLLLGQAVAC